MRKFSILLGILLFLVSCGNVGKVLRNEKISSTDEFLVEKKGPLVLPPDYNKIPAPDTIIEKNENDENKIKRIGANHLSKLSKIIFKTITQFFLFFEFKLSQ